MTHTGTEQQLKDIEQALRLTREAHQHEVDAYRPELYKPECDRRPKDQLDRLCDLICLLQNILYAAQQASRRTQVVPQVEVTDCMALAFHNAVTDGPIGEDDFNDIKTGLHAALATAPEKPKFDASKLQKLLERLQLVTDEGPPDEGWKSTALEEGIAELERMLAASPQQPESNSAEFDRIEAAPVQMPEPVAFALEWTFNGEERGMRLYDDETHCRFDAESDGGVCHPLYTEHQVRQLLAAKGVKEKARGHDPANCWCQACDIATSQYGFRTRMSLCPKCGDKRCPRAQHHGFQCQSEKKD